MILKKDRARNLSGICRKCMKYCNNMLSIPQMMHAGIEGSAAPVSFFNHSGYMSGRQEE
jgi:hypothetical protein